MLASCLVYLDLNFQADSAATPVKSQEVAHNFGCDKGGFGMMSAAWLETRPTSAPFFRPGHWDWQQSHLCRTT